MRKKDNLQTVKQVIERNVGMTASEFLSGKESYFIKNMKEAVTLVYRAFKSNQFIFVMSDYDVDGVSSGCVFETLFRAAGYTNYRIRFPKRFSEGYGIRESVIDEIPEGALLITVDNGITAIEPVKKAKDKGITVLIVDHHQPKTDKSTNNPVLPEADVIVDPHATGECTFNYYCGAGLAYKLCSAFIQKGHPNEQKMLAYASLATIADVMPLIEENRDIVKRGLELLCTQTARTTGTYALLKAFGMDQYITETDVGFYIAPSINAMSRMNDDGARLAFETLTFDGRLDTAEQMALNMHETNADRKELTQVSEEKVHKLILEEGLFEHTPMCVYIPGLHEGIIGIIAGDLTTEYKRPVIVFTDNGDTYKGSGRTYGGVNLYSLLEVCDPLFIGWGGHAEAAGMSILPENLSALRAALQKAFIEQGCVIEDQDDTYDLEITADDLPSVIKELDQYRPFGMGNPNIRFLIKGYRLEYKAFAKGYTSLMGKKQEHIKLFSNRYDTIAFGLAKKYEEDGKPLTIDLVGTLSKNHYVSKRTCKLIVMDQIECIDFTPIEEPNMDTQMSLELQGFADSIYMQRRNGGVAS